MGRKELALALQQKGEAEAKTIWQQAEAEAARYRQQRQQEVARQSTDSGRQADRSALQVCRQVDWRVTKKVRALRLQALRALDRRLWQISGAALRRLEPQLRQQCLAGLRAELPASDWQDVTVHAEDAASAKKLFPDARIETDDGCGGGLIVAAKAGAIRIDNTLRKRLENYWPVMVGRILAELEQGAGNGND